MVEKFTAEFQAPEEKSPGNREKRIRAMLEIQSYQENRFSI